MGQYGQLSPTLADTPFRALRRKVKRRFNSNNHFCPVVAYNDIITVLPLLVGSPS